MSEGIAMGETVEARKRILELIEEAAEPRDKALMLVMLQLIDATREIAELAHRTKEAQAKHDERFALHEEREKALMNQGRGAYKAALGLIGLVQVVLIAVGSHFYNDFIRMGKELEMMKTQAAVHQERHRIEDRQNDDPPVPVVHQPVLPVADQRKQEK